MFRNYLAAALHNLVRNKLYAAINIIGLAVGFAAALLIALFVRDELTYDRWMPGHERTYRVAGHSIEGAVQRAFDYVPLAAADALKQDFPGIEAITRIGDDRATVRNGDREFVETLSWAELSLLDVLPLPVLAGDARAALADPDGIILTRSQASKYFGRDTPIGETLEFDRQYSMRVAAVLEDLPSDTHLDLGIVASARSAHAPVATRDASNIDSIGYVYLRLVPGEGGRVAAKTLRQGLPAFNDRHPEVTQRRFPVLIDEIVAIADIHLRPTGVGAMKAAGSRDTAYNALAIAALIMIVAGFNFVNLTTARAVRRAVEVGVRKVSGAMRRQLMAQFIGELIFFAALGMAAAVALAALMLPSFDSFLQRTTALDFDKDPILPVAIIAVVALVGVSAGAYPALVLSRFAPAAVLKGSLDGRRARGMGRQILVALQFAVLIGLALTATAIHRQVRYATNDALRFDKEQMLLVNRACLPPLVTEIRALPGVRDLACSLGYGAIGGDSQIEVAGPDGTKARSKMGSVGFGFFELYGQTPVAGRLFAAEFGSDAMPESGKFTGPSRVVINEAMGRALGFVTPQDAVGKTARFMLPFVRNTEHVETAAEIIGVVQDFQILTPGSRSKVGPPSIFFVDPFDLYRNGTINVRLAGNQIPETFAAIDALWKKLGPPRPVDRVFLDQTIDNMYREFTRQSQIVAAFAAVAVFISCLGLFGLAAFTAEQRTKEIGVRKALGASNADIVRLMLWEFMRPVLWGSLIAWPFGYVIMRRWLDGFADRVDIGLWTFPVATLLALAIAVITIAGHALLVARAEPVKALRYE